MSSNVTVTGVNELRSDVASLDAKVESRMRAVAFVTANRVASSARSIARGHGWQTTPTEIVVRDGNSAGRVIPGSVKSAVSEINRATAEKNAYIVEATPGGNRPANLPLWLELGTVKMTARPFMFPAANLHRAAYIADQERGLQDVLNATVNR